MTGCDGSHGGPERWLPIARFPAYEVSSHGRVRRIGAKEPLVGGRTNRGYRKYNFGRGPGGQPYAHQLVAEAFLGERPKPSCEPDHRDWDKDHNCAANLKWLEKRDNCVRWKARVSGRNVWATPDEPDEDAGEPMQPAELDEWAGQMQASGW